MPLDLRALVDSTIEKEEKKLAKWLAAVETKQKAAEREVVEQLLFRDYVEKSVEMNPNQVSSTLRQVLQTPLNRRGNFLT